MATPATSREIYVRLLRYVRPYWRTFALSILTMAIMAATEPLLPALLKPLLDGSFVKRDASNLKLIPMVLIGLFLLRGVVGYLGSYATSWVSNKIVLDLRREMFARLLALPTRYFDDQTSGSLISKIAYDVSGVTSAATTVLTVLVRDAFTIIALLAWLFWLNWKLTMVSLIVIPGIALAVKVFSKRLRRMSQESMRAMADMTHVLQEATDCHKVVKIFGGQDYEARRFAHVNQQLRGYNMRQGIAASAVVPIVQLFAAVAVAIIVTIAVQQTAANQLSVGGFVSFVTTMLLLLAPLRRLTEVNAPLQRGLASSESVFRLLDERPEDDRGTGTLPRAQGRIEFERVSFSYPGSEREALEDISIRIQPGETLALVGPSGGGKSTFVNLIPRFYEPTEGRILIDGMDAREIGLAGLRQSIALVSQDVALFNDSVAANIAYGRMGGATREAVESAARAAHALDFIQEMPQGFDTLIGENGVRLSGGQRQRLAIARALLKDAPILLLDEATSALDSESERHVQAALAELMRGRTTIVIAHRLSTIEHADRIVVLQRGRIAEVGNHAELFAKNGVYAQLYRIQFALEQEGAPA